MKPAQSQGGEKPLDLILRPKALILFFLHRPAAGIDHYVQFFSSPSSVKSMPRLNIIPIRVLRKHYQHRIKCHVNWKGEDSLIGGQLVVLRIYALKLDSKKTLCSLRSCEFCDHQHLETAAVFGTWIMGGHLWQCQCAADA